MKVRILKNENILGEEYYNQFVGKEFEVIDYDEIYDCFTLPVPSIKGEPDTYWYGNEVEVVDEEDYENFIEKITITKKEYEELLEYKFMYESLNK